MADAIRVLLVDDETEFAKMSRRYVEREYDDVAIDTAGSVRAGLERLDEAEYDCVVSDYDMPETDGLAFLDAVREEYPDLPFVMFTGRGNESVASQAVSAGVSDYVVKRTSTEQYEVLVERIRKAVSRRDTEAALRRSEQRYRDLVESAPVPTAVYTAEGFALVNDRAVAFFGADDADDLTGRSPADFLPEGADDLSRVVRDRESVGPAERTFETPDGRRVATVSATPATHEGRPAGQLVVEDHTPVRAATAARERERRIAETAMEGTDRLLYVVDDGGRLVRWNDQLSAVTGYADGELADRPLTDVVEPGDDAGGPAERENGEVTYAGRLATRDGRELDYEFREVLLPGGADGHGGRCGVAVPAGDDGGRARALGRQRDRLETVVENLPIVLFVFDGEGVVTRASGEGLPAFGLDGDGVAGASVFDLFADHPDLLAACERALGGESAEATVDAGDRSFQTRVEPDADDPDRVVATAIDVTERRERERELERYRTVVEAAGDAMYAIDTEGYMTMVNQAQTEFTGASREELLGSHVSEYMREEDVRTGTEKIVELLKDDDNDVARFELRDEDGTLYPGDERTVYEDIIAVITDDDGEYQGSVGVIRDITERVQRQRELERQNERLDEFASVVAHDLRSPLAVAKGYFELVEKKYDDEDVERGLRSIDRIDDLLGDLLTLARQGETVDETEVVDLSTVVGEAWRNTDTVEADLAVESVGTVEADPSRLGQLFENLFRNAVEHGGEDVTVRVSTGPNRIRVDDDGPGVPPEERDRIFEHGYTTSEGGTGFGLAIVNRIAGAHGWEVSVGESPDGGARFVIEGVRLGIAAE